MDRYHRPPLASIAGPEELRSMRTGDLPGAERLDSSAEMLDLMPDLDELSVLLRASLSGGLLPSLEPAEQTFDSFLLVGGMNQIVEDYLHRDVYALGKVAGRIAGPGDPRPQRATAATLEFVRNAALGLRAGGKHHRALVRWQADLAALVARLALEVARGVASSEAGTTGPGERDERDRRLLQASEDLLRRVTDCPEALRKTVVRLAHCFRSFDQRPEDCRLLAGLFAEAFPDRDRPLLVIGLRTSGAYLAPLQSAFFNLEGYGKTEFLTIRPGDRFLSHELNRIAETVLEEGLVCVVDDPPRTGAQLAVATAALLAAGVPRRSIVLLVQLFGRAESLPSQLQDYQSVLLPWDRWSIHEKLRAPAVQATLTRLLGGHSIDVATESESREVLVGAVEDVVRVEAAAANASPSRGHVAAVFRTRLVDEPSGDSVQHDVYVRGVGLGFLGRHALAVASGVSDYVPPVYGVDDGLLYRAWLPESWRLSPPTLEEPFADRVAAYAVARRDNLAVDRDPSSRLAGRGAAWEIVADMLRDPFGRAKDVSRPLTDRAAFLLTRPARASVVDGSMALSHWFARSAERLTDGAVWKVDFDERAFSNAEVYCYDAALDVACAAADSAAFTPADSTAQEFSDRLRKQYERKSGDAITDERWLLYQLLYHRHRERSRYGPAVTQAAADDAFNRLLAGRHAMALAHQRYFGDLFFADLTAPESGPICAIDLDWVLETRWLSFPAISYAGAAAMRALRSHGYRPVIATGRSLAELRARCAAFRLAGGVAEYGAIVYSHRSGSARTPLTPTERDELAALRAILLEAQGVGLDPAYDYGIRAHRLDSDGELCGLDETTVQDALERTGAPERFRAITTATQTDFKLAHVDKGAGLRLLMEMLDGGPAKPAPAIAFAIGDSVEDLPMLALAECPFAPSNADPELRTAGVAGSPPITIVSRPNQTGLLEAVTEFLGHRPHLCGVCALPRSLSPDARIFLAALGAIEGGAREKIKQSVLLAVRIRGYEAERGGLGR